MSLEQFTYTGSPWGATAPGWTVFQSSPGVGPKTASSLIPVFEFKLPNLGEEADPETIGDHSLPIRFVYCRRSVDGGRVISQSLDAGPRWYDKTRGRDYFAHVFLEKGEGDVFDGTPASFNPMAMLMSPSMQTEFPHEFRERALGILNGDYPNEPTPPMPRLETLSSIEPNPDFSDAALLDKLSPALISKLGAIVAAMMRFAAGTDNAKLVVDGTKSMSLVAMATAVRMLPPGIRRDISFATWLPSNELRAFPDADCLLFTGTHRRNESADPDTGLYGDLPQDGLLFKSRSDIECFIRMADACGTGFVPNDFNGLVSCWEIATGRKADAISLRNAARFAGRFPDLMGEVEKGLSDRLGGDCANGLPLNLRLACIVAGYELGMNVADSRGWMNDFACDSSLFTNALKTLEGDTPRKKFANDVAEAASASGSSDKLASMWLGCKGEVRSLLHLGEDGAFSRLALLAERYDAIRADVAKGVVKPGTADSLLDVVNEAAGRFGDDFGGMAETRAALGYASALDGLRGVDDIKSFAEAIRGFRIDEERIRADIFEKVKPDGIPVERLVEAMEAFKQFGIREEDVLRQVIKGAEKRGREDGESRGRRLVREANARTAEAESHCGCPPWLAISISVAALALGLVGGWILGSLHSSGTLPKKESSIDYRQGTKSSVPGMGGAGNTGLVGSAQYGDQPNDYSQGKYDYEDENDMLPQEQEDASEAVNTSHDEVAPKTIEPMANQEPRVINQSRSPAPRAPSRKWNE